MPDYRQQSSPEPSNMAFFLHWYENVLSLLCVDRIYLCYQQNLEGLDMDTEKKSLVSREIRSFRDTYRVSWLLLILALRTLLVWFLCWVSQCLFYEYSTACIIGHKVQLELQGYCTQQELWEQKIDQIKILLFVFISHLPKLTKLKHLVFVLQWCHEHSSCCVAIICTII